MRMIAALSLVFLLPAVSLAQRVAAPSIGTRIRTTPKAPAEPYIMGTVIAQAGDTIALLVPPADTVRMALGSLSMVEVSDGQRSNFGKGARYGMLIGTAGGIAIGAAAIDSEWRGVGALLGAGTGALIGVLIGGGIGSSSTSERWKPAPGWELSVTAQPGRGGGVGISIRF